MRLDVAIAADMLGVPAGVWSGDPLRLRGYFKKPRAA
jgi:hypothetical protein